MKTKLIYTLIAIATIIAVYVFYILLTGEWTARLH